jgi:hypothetical protein
MKTIIISLLVCLGTVAYGGIMELPEGTSVLTLPDYNNVRPFDQATVSGWGSSNPQGNSVFYLPGGTLYNTDFFQLSPTPVADIWWNFGDQGFLGYSLRYVEVVTLGDVAIYLITYPTNFAGTLTVSGHDMTDIQALVFYGRTPQQGLPDGGNTAALMALSLLCCAVAWRER